MLELKKAIAVYAIAFFGIWLWFWFNAIAICAIAFSGIRLQVAIVDSDRITVSGYAKSAKTLAQNHCFSTLVRS